MTGCGYFVDLGGLSEPEPQPVTDGGSAVVDASDTAPPPNQTQDAGEVDAGAKVTYRDLVLADKPIAYWPLDDGQGSLVAKDIVGGKNANVSGAAKFGVAGVAGTALQIDDRATYLEVGDLFDFPDKAPFTIEVWALPKLDEQFTNVGNKRGAGGNGWVLYFWDTGEVQFEQKWSNGQRVGYSEAPRTFAAPAHVVVTFDGAKLAMYYDNEKLLKTFQDATGGPADLTNAMMWAGGYAGLLDELAIYDFALPPEKVTAHFKAVRP